jgi:hypothetical protein
VIVQVTPASGLPSDTLAERQSLRHHSVSCEIRSPLIICYTSKNPQIIAFMNVFCPTVGRWLLIKMLAVAVVGALIAGIYGIAHDQITYSISPEYFSKMKFEQFRSADFGFSDRIFVAEIGFLATWWVGLCSAWFLARMALPVWSPAIALRRVAESFGIMILVAFLAGLSGYLLGGLDPGTSQFWREICLNAGVIDVPSFVRVGYVHIGGYIGGFVGLVIGLLHLQRYRKGGCSALY